MKSPIKYSKGKDYAQRLMNDLGISCVEEFPLELIASFRGATLIKKPLKNSDGRIVITDSRSIITLNSDILYEGKRRFTLAHELGHLEMHKDQFLHHNDTDATLEYFKSGEQEAEANEFASELLMPESLFLEACKGKPFSPNLLRDLSEQFQTSITSVAYKYLELGLHPICLVYCYNNKVKYWKASCAFKHYIVDRTRIAPPSDSVASEWFDKGIIYRKEESAQPIYKSTWFKLRDYGESDNDYNFFEYCIVTKAYNTTLSIIWEE